MWGIKALVTGLGVVVGGGEGLTSIHFLLTVDFHDNKLLTHGERGQRGGDKLSEPEGKLKRRFKKIPHLY